MIPLRLTLKNFMSYRDGSPPLDFAPLHTACLSGDNGAGKSALLAAMTWALWGEAHAHADDEDLITQGEHDMSVDFEFALGDTRYRVLRSRQRRGKTSNGRLYFQIKDSDSGWRDISGDSLRGTQRLITERLRMDYPTFVNSAFLKQGRADEFTNKNPTERKEILARILGLDEYDRLAECARERARNCESDRRSLITTLADLDREIARKPELQAQAVEVAGYVAAARAAWQAAQAAAETLGQRVAALETQARELENVRGRAAQDEMEIDKAQRAIVALEAHLARYAETLARRETILTNYRRLQELRAWERALRERADRHHELTSEITRLERAIDAARNRLANEIELEKRTIADQGRVAATAAALEAQVAEVRAELAHFAALEDARLVAQTERDQLQQQVAEWQGANTKLEEEAGALKKKLELLDEAIRQAEAAARARTAPCPLCGTLLDPVARDRVREGYTADILARRLQYKQNKREIDAARKGVETLAARLAELETQLKARMMAERREAALEGQLAQAREAQTRVALAAANLQALQVRLEVTDFAVTEHADLAARQAEQRALAYNPAELRQIETECRQLEVYEPQQADLQRAEERQAADQAQLAREQENLAGHQARVAREHAEIVRLSETVADLVALRTQSMEQGARLKYEQDRLERLSREEAALARQLEDLGALEARRESSALALDRATTDKGLYDDLAKAFGKGGIQAMIIEQVVPELAETANYLLARMTDNGMHLAFETQRMAKTRESTIETLDIKITDGAGVARKYEMFSGGEAFRINFAVRVALSKLLARRAGAQLQTLIIDEGFGTQDAQGRERLVQAIRSIQDDFEKILVITHIDELKDEFATRIDVVKTAGGSIAVVN